MTDSAHARLAQLPKVDRVLDHPRLRASPWAPTLEKRVVTRLLDELRQRILAGEDLHVPGPEALAEEVADILGAWMQPRPRRVINATGVLLHTNLGRAPLSRAAIEAMVDAARACDLEIDLDRGARGSRFIHLRPFLAALVGAQDVHVVNNGAAALLLACTALAGNATLAISRGQMIEIGDGFRVADMACAAGARLRELGSTNRTHLSDYEAALAEGASAVLWVHRSNFDQSGFVEDVELRALAALTASHGVPLIADLGSGSLGVGLPAHEPTIHDYLDAGASIVTCSGDKLLGGPQAGLMAGDADAIHRCRRHPMARALRPDKTTLAALHATLSDHAREQVPALPVHAMVGATVAQLRERGLAIVRALGWGEDRLRDTTATVGGGSLPGDNLPSLGIGVTRERPNQAARQLRLGTPAVVGRVHDDELVVDLRSVAPDEDAELIAALRGVDPPDRL